MTMSATSDASPAGYRIDASYDTKKRLFIDGALVGGHTWTVHLNTYGIPANAWAGGATTRDVYVAYYYEDDARDDLPVSIQ